MTVEAHDSRRWMGLLPALLALVLFLPACGQESRGPVVLKMQGSSMTLDDLRIEYDMRNKPGDFDRATPEEREQFLRTIADKEILVREARAAIGDLTPDEVQRVKDGSEDRLLRSLETVVSASTDADTAAAEKLVKEKFHVEARLLHFAGATDSITYWAHDEVVKGRPLSELVRVHGVDPLMREKGGQLNWMTAIQLGYELAEELILDPKPAGYITDVRRSMRGWEFFQVQEYRPVDITAFPDAPGMMRSTVQRIRHRMVVQAFLDSMKTANGVEILDDAGAVLHQAMSAYWDSLSAEVKRTGERPKEFHPPRWRVPAESQSMTLVRVGGKDVSIRQFIDGLPAVGARVWPNAVKYDHFRKQIEARVLIELQLVEASRRGLDRTPEHLAAARQDEEKILLDRFYEQAIIPQVEMTDEMVQKVYEETKDEFYTQKEKMRLSYMIFPKESEALGASSGKEGSMTTFGGEGR